MLLYAPLTSKTLPMAGSRIFGGFVSYLWRKRGLPKCRTYLLFFAHLIQLILGLWYSVPLWCSAECPDSPCPFGLIMMEGGGRLTQPWGKTAYTSFCLFHVEGKLLLTLLPDGVQNKCTHLFHCCRPCLKSVLSCACKDTSSDRGATIGVPTWSSVQYAIVIL